MKKYLGILFALVLVLSFSLVTAVPVGANPEPTLTIGDISVVPGDTVTVPIMANDVAPFVEAAIDLRYDPGVVIVTEVTSGNGPPIVDSEISPGHLNTMQFLSSCEGDVVIAYVTFEAVGSPGASCALHFSVEGGWTTGGSTFLGTHLSDMGGTDIPLTLIDGTFTVEKIYEVWVADDGDDSNPGTEADPFLTIQQGIDTVAEGGMVNVVAGIYTENVVIDEALTVKSTDGAAETIIEGITCYVVNIRHSDVTFEGFTLTNPDIVVSDPAGILVSDPAPYPKDATIVNNVYVLNNIVKAVGASTVYGATGINIGPSSDVVISGNTIENIKDIKEPEETSHGPCGINVWGTTEVDMPFNIEISNNEISGIYNGILLQYASGVQIKNNNTITGCETGIRVEPFVGATVSGLTVNLNNIAGNTEYGVANFDLALLVDATHNWWGHASGPYHPVSNPNGLGNAVSNNVVFDPWLYSFYTADPGAAALSMTATFAPSIGIKVEPTSVNFGEVAPGVPSYHQMVRVINTGTIAEEFTASIENESHPPVYADGLAIDGSSVGMWNLPSVSPKSYHHTDLTLTVPAGTAAGTYTAVLVFWAEVPK